MAKKKKQAIPEGEKIFQVFNNIYSELDWPIGWENESPEDLTSHIVDFIYEKLFTENDPIPVPRDIVYHQTLNSFKGNSDTLKAFLFMDTAELGGVMVWDDELPLISRALKGTLVIIKGYDYSFDKSLSKKRRVLEIIF
jgi:hypothetical protein